MHEGNLDARGLRVALVVSRFNDLFTEKLLAGALDCLVRHGARDDELHVVRVPGSFEVPLAAQECARSDRFDAVVCLAAVIRGATPHFEYVAAEITKGIAQTALATGVPVTYGVLTTDTLEQAVERAGTKSGNKGWDAAAAAIEMVQVLRGLRTAAAGASGRGRGPRGRTARRERS
jgi:6,7-dimethyl-8-ribityllumazine synthase